MLHLKKWMPLLLLTVAGFTFNTSELTPIGLLTDIAGSFGVSESDAGIVALAALCLLWGLALTVYNIAFQNEVIELSPYNSAVAMSIYSGIFNLGIGSGAFVGGIVCSGGLMAEIGYIGGAIALSAAAFCLLRYLPARHF